MNKTRLAAVVAVLAAGAFALWYFRSAAPKAAAEEKPLDPAVVIEVGRDIDYDRLEFAPDGGWVVVGEGFRKVLVADGVTGEMITTANNEAKPDAPELFRRRVEARLAAKRPAEAFARAFAAAGAGPLPLLPQVGVSGSALDKLKHATDDKGFGGGFGWVTGGDRGFFRLVPQDKGFAAVGVVTAVYDWRRNQEDPTAKENERVSMSAVTSVESTFTKGGSSRTSVYVGVDGAFTVAAGPAPDGTTFLAKHNDAFRLVDTKNGLDGAGRPVKLGDEKKLSPLCLLSARRAVVIDGGNVLTVRDLDTGAVVATMHGKAEAVVGHALTRDGKALAVSRAFGISVYDTATGDETAIIREAGGRVPALSADGRYVLAQGPKGLCHVWDAAGRKRLAALAGTEDAMATGFSPDGSRAAVVAGGKLRVFAVPKGE